MMDFGGTHNGVFEGGEKEVLEGHELGVGVVVHGGGGGRGRGCKGGWRSGVGQPLSLLCILRPRQISPGGRSDGVGIDG